MSQQKPSIGRIVHYQAYGTPGGEFKSEPYPAVITSVEIASVNIGGICDQQVDLFVMYPNGTSHKPSVPFSEEPKPGHWNWPPRT